ncbi:MAG: TonB-dependent receptor [Verrucomicrobiota bacterium]
MAASGAEAQTGGVAGVAINTTTGTPVTGATVRVVGVDRTATTDLKGGFQIEGVPAGTVDLRVEKSGLQPVTITSVNVAPGAIARVDVPLAGTTDGVVKMEAFAVAASTLASSDVGLLGERQKAVAVSDAIGSDQFSRLAVSNAAEAMTKVTGASLIDGKYVMIRGLGDRYSNTLLNGVSVPTADPDKRAVQMDQFPADLIESIVTTKSFTPDQSGAFSGGSVNLRTKSFPEQFFLSLSAQVEYNSRVTRKDTLTVPGASGDNLARGASDRAAPALPVALPDRTAASLAARTGNFAPADQLDAASKAFDNRGYFPSTKRAAPDTGFSLAFGDRVALGGRDALFGYTASFTYDHDTSHYTGGEKNRFEGIVSAPQTKLALTPDRTVLTFKNAPQPAGAPALGVTSTTDTVSWGAFVKLAYRPVAAHELSLDLFHNQSADDLVQRGVGEQQRDYPGNFYEVYDLLYTERGVSSAQLAGKSLFAEAGDLKLDYRLSYSKSTQDQPDYRTLAGYYDLDGLAVNATGVQPNRFFRELAEDSREIAVDATKPFLLLGRSASFKTGLSWLQGDRDYTEQRFQWSNRPQSRSDFVNFPGQVGIIDRTATSVNFGNTIARLQEPNNYTAEQTISAAYAMVDLPATERLRAILGVRLEKTEMETIPVRVPGLNPRDGLIDEDDPLPALSLVYTLNARSNLRAAYGRTIARPTFKELTDIRYEDVFTLDTYLGNPTLRRTLLENFDVRWEWFPRRAETVAISAFYKKMSDPIEVVFTPSTGATQPQNVDEGKVYGIELEFRRGLGAWSEALKAFSFGANLALIASEVSIPDAEMASIRLAEPNARAKRELLGQSPYVFNADLTYSRRSSGTTATVSYNIVGERLSLVQFGSLPDVYEQPAGRLNFVLSQRLTNRLRLKFSAKNLLDADSEKLVGFESYDLVYERYRTGRSFAVALTWLFE